MPDVDNCSPIRTGYLPRANSTISHLYYRHNRPVTFASTPKYAAFSLKQAIYKPYEHKKKTLPMERLVIISLNINRRLNTLFAVSIILQKFF